MDRSVKLSLTAFGPLILLMYPCDGLRAFPCPFLIVVRNCKEYHFSRWIAPLAPLPSFHLKLPPSVSIEPAAYQRYCPGQKRATSCALWVLATIILIILYQQNYSTPAPVL